MTNQEILEKAIQKAVDSGWKKVIDDSPATIASVTKWTVAWNTEKWKKDGGYYGEDVSTLIFSHDFAKALWGEYRNSQYDDHYIPARGYPGKPIPKEEIKDSHDDANWVCTRCGKKWARCFEAPCELLNEGNRGWKSHLAEMVLTEDPIKYLGEHI